MRNIKYTLIAFICACLLVVSSINEVEAKSSKKSSKSKTEKTSKSSKRSKHSRDKDDDERPSKKSKKSKHSRDKDDDERPSKKSKKSKHSRDKDDDDERPSKKSKKSKHSRDKDDDDERPSKKSKRSKKSKKSRRNRDNDDYVSSKKSRKKLKVKISKINENARVEVAAIDTLSEGAFHKVYYIDQGSCHFTVHVLESDLRVPFNGIAIMKADNYLSGLEKLQKIAHDFDSSNAVMNILGAVNGNFWRAYSNYPIGPLVINGEVIELKSYKDWTSGFFDNRNKLYIDKFKIDCKLRQKNGTVYTIDDVNRRSDPNSIILYNRFGGDTIPYVSEKKFNKALENALNDDSYRDSTDLEFDTLALKKEIKLNQRYSTVEYSIPKLTLKYLTPPAINKKITCIVASIDTGAVEVPVRGCLISLGKNIMSIRGKVPEIGDTVELKYTTNVHSNKIFLNAVCGTPRLVRNDKPRQEAVEEGSHGNRFINGKLPRTAIGTDKDQNILYLAAIAPYTRGRIGGASLSDLAVIMKLIGAYNAMNLDGGGSTIMSINEENILNKSNPEASRRLSVGVGIGVKHKKKLPFEKLKELKEEQIKDEE